MGIVKIGPATKILEPDSPGYDSGSISDEENESPKKTKSPAKSFDNQKKTAKESPPRNSSVKSSRSSSPVSEENMDDLKAALDRNGDFKYTVSEELIKTGVHMSRDRASR